MSIEPHLDNTGASCRIDLDGHDCCHTCNAVEIWRELQRLERELLLALGWKEIAEDAWHAPSNYSDKRPADYVYTTGHALNGTKLMIHSLKRLGARTAEQTVAAIAENGIP